MIKNSRIKNSKNNQKINKHRKKTIMEYRLRRRKIRKRKRKQKTSKNNKKYSNNKMLKKYSNKSGWNIKAIKCNRRNRSLNGKLFYKLIKVSLTIKNN